MHIAVSGNGPALVLIHGWALQGEVFAPLLERLSSTFTLHVVDLPGHGRSRDDATPLELQAIATAIAAATPPAVWCGWSLGGLFALHAAATLPQVQGLVMLASSPRFVREEGWPHAVPAPVFTQFARDLADDFPATVDRFLALDLMNTDPARGDLRGLRQRLLDAGAPDPRVLEEGARLLQSADLRDALPALRTPSLWLPGHRDRLVPPAAAHAAAALCPAGSATAQTIAHGGHAPFLGQADEVAAQLQHFITTQVVTAAGRQITMLD